MLCIHIRTHVGTGNYLGVFLSTVTHSMTIVLVVKEGVVITGVVGAGGGSEGGVAGGIGSHSAP